MTEHKAVYLGAPKTVYESRCSCGWTKVEATGFEASAAWHHHAVEMHNEAQSTD